MAQKRAVAAIVGLVYRLMPAVPTKSKWTKLGPCLDWHMVAQGLMNILGLTVPFAFGQMLSQAHTAAVSQALCTGQGRATR